MWSLLVCLLFTNVVAAGRTVHVVFSNHLDIGFDNIEPYIGYDNNVLNMYFNRYLPLAVENADWMQRVSPHQDRYTYTTHAYLLSLFLDCPTGMGLKCPGPFTKATVIQGIKSGAITWHAHPHNAQYELYDPSLLEFSIDLVHHLDRGFGFKPKHTAILRDVPGLTRAVIPILVAKGIKAVSIGVNPGSAPPAVPQYTPFIWRDEATNMQLLAFWRPGGYGGIHGGVNLDPPEQCIQAPGLDHVLCTAWRNDNAGVGGTGSSSNNVTIKASSFDDFVDAVLDALPQLNLTVVTGEIGDTWVFGVQSDPLKTANFRAASRGRAHCISTPHCPSDDSSFYNFSRLLLKVPEHTWGVDVKKTLHDWENFTNTDFHSCLPHYWKQQRQQDGTEPMTNSSLSSSCGAGDGVPLRKGPCHNYEHCLHAWDRQAAYIDWALQKTAGSSRQCIPACSGCCKTRSKGKSSPAAAVTKRTAAAATVLEGRVHSSRSRSSRHLRHWPHNIAVQYDMQQQHQLDTAKSFSKSHVKTGTASGLGVRNYTCGSWAFKLDEAQGAITSLQKLYSNQQAAGVDWAASSSSSGSSDAQHHVSSCGTGRKSLRGGVLGQIKYSAYCEASYDVIWKYYAWQLPLPWWFAQDFSGRVNSSRAWNKEVAVVASLEEIFESFAPGAAGEYGNSSREVVQLWLRYSFPKELVEKVGAPETMWTVISCPPMSPIPASSSTAAAGDLDFAVVWQSKAPTRLPEAIWLSFVPAVGAVDPHSWRLHKLNSLVDPNEVILNGSQSMHAVSDAGVSVYSADHREVLQLKTWDTALVSPGKPTPFPNGVFPPCMDEGVHFNLMNNIWGTNYVMWVPYSKDDVNMAFRFSIHAEQLPAAARSAGHR